MTTKSQRVRAIYDQEHEQSFQLGIGKKRWATDNTHVEKLNRRELLARYLYALHRRVNWGQLDRDATIRECERQIKRIDE
jgi:hypothetical protein